MASLKDIKHRINSVRSTLKITSAMKHLSAAKLHKTQQLIEPLRVYKQELEYCLSQLGEASIQIQAHPKAKDRICIIAMSSNSSLCGAFNTIAINKTLEVLSEQSQKEAPVCYFLGKRLCEALLKKGYKSEENLNKLLDHPSYDKCAELIKRILKDFKDGEYKAVKIISQNKCIDFLPAISNLEYKYEDAPEDRFILEPSIEKIREKLFYKVLKTDFYYMLIENCLKEHTARTQAMQTASDNAENMIAELSLEYNKTRQAKITAEILDLQAGTKN